MSSSNSHNSSMLEGICKTASLYLPEKQRVIISSGEYIVIKDKSHALFNVELWGAKREVLYEIIFTGTFLKCRNFLNKYFEECRNKF